MERKNKCFYGFNNSKPIIRKLTNDSLWLKVALLILSIFCFTLNTTYATQTTVAYVKAIKYDYISNSYYYDALTLRNSDGTYANVPEMEYYVYSGKVAYKRGQSNRKIKVSFAVNCPSSDLTINIQTVSGTSLGTVSNFTVSNYSPESYVEIPLSGVLPNVIGEHYCKWKFSITVSPNVAGYSSSNNYHYYDFNYYTTYSYPLGSEEDPRLDILNYACNWLNGQRGTIDDISTALLDAIEEHYDWEGTCAYISSDYARLLRTLGIEAHLHRWSSWGPHPIPEGAMSYQRTVPIDPIGNHPYATYEFFYHQWAEAGGVIRDPTTNLNYNGSWMDYEDLLYTHYQRIFGINNYQWDVDYFGQFFGCESSQYRIYTYDGLNWHNWSGPTK